MQQDETQHLGHAPPCEGIKKISFYLYFPVSMESEHFFKWRTAIWNYYFEIFLLFKLSLPSNISWGLELWFYLIPDRLAYVLELY